jgi:hypothetical protein
LHDTAHFTEFNRTSRYLNSLCLLSWPRRVPN